MFEDGGGWMLPPDLQDPAFGNILATDPEQAAQHLAAAGVPPPASADALKSPMGSGLIPPGFTQGFQRGFTPPVPGAPPTGPVNSGGGIGGEINSPVGPPVSSSPPITPSQFSGDVPMPTPNPIGGLAPTFRTQAADARNEAAKRGVYVNPGETLRSQDRQNKLFGQGRTSGGPIVTGTLNSNHISGNATDWQPYAPKDEFGNELAPAPTADQVGKTMTDISQSGDPRFAGTRSGATFRGPFGTGGDPLHFENNQRPDVATQVPPPGGAVFGSLASGGNVPAGGPGGSGTAYAGVPRTDANGNLDLSARSQQGPSAAARALMGLKAPVVPPPPALHPAATPGGHAVATGSPLTALLQKAIGGDPGAILTLRQAVMGGR